ncbi:MAG: TonB-dependent receptor, partial [Woeseiaceae bacterium]
TTILLVFGVTALADDAENGQGNPESTSAEEESDQYLDEIVVIGSRRRELLQEVGLAISSVEPEEFVTDGLVMLEDAIDYTAGVHFTGEGNWGLGKVFMRGVTQESSTPVVAVYVDDVPLTPEVPYVWAQIRMFDGMLGDIERVEFIKGPQGTLYGASAVGGVIRYVTRDPSLDEASGRVAVDLSNTAHGEWNERYKFYGSLPIVEDRLAIAATGMYGDQGGYLDRIDPASGWVEHDINPFDLVAGSVSVLSRVSDASSLKLLASRHESDFAHGTQGVNYDYPSLTPTYGYYTTDAPSAPGTITFDIYAATLNVDLDWASVTYVTALTGYDDREWLDVTPAFGEFVDEEVGAPPGTNTLPITIHAEVEKRTHEFRLTSDDNDALEWLTGIYFAGVETDLSQHSFSVPSGYHLFTFEIPSKYRELALYGNLTWFLRPDLDITLGARYSDIEMRVQSRNAGLLGAGDPDSEVFFAGEIDDRVTTMLLGARWRPNSESSFYLRFANGYRPAVPRLALPGEVNSDSLAKSDDLRSYELGTKGTSLDGNLGYDIALWAVDWNDFQAIVKVNSIATVGNSESDISARGFEADFRYRPNNEFEIDLSIGYADSRLDDDAPTIGGLEGDRLRYLPRWTGSLRGKYKFPLAGFDASVGAGLRYVGSYPTAYSSGVPGCGCELNFPVDDYVLVDGNMTMAAERYGLSLYATNLLDDTGLASAGAADAFSNQLASGASVRPRTIGVYLWTNF